MREAFRIDCHVHLQDPLLAQREPDVIAQTRRAGVRWMVCNSTGPGDWEPVYQLARRHADVLPCFGLHPWHVLEAEPGWLERLEQYLRAVPSAVGEVGLDRWITEPFESLQEQCFLAQLDLAQRLGRPMMIHCLKAHDWLLRLLREKGPPSAEMMLHGFGGPVEYIKPLAEMGAYFSFSGRVLDPQRRRARDAQAAVPIDRLLTETDAPDMLPPEPYCPFPLQGAEDKRCNSPANLPGILRGIAEMRGMAEEDLAAVVWANARRLLGPLLEGRAENAP